MITCFIAIEFFMCLYYGGVVATIIELLAALTIVLNSTY